MKVCMIDNYDSFTYNLAHLVRELGATVTVYRNDQFNMEQIEPFDKIILSPGPGIPSEAGQLLAVIKTFAGRKPILGVCLGHQAIGEVFGGQLTNLSSQAKRTKETITEVFHGIQTEGTQHRNDYIFDGLPTRIAMGRYHSWVVSKEHFPDCLEITAESDEGQIMALRHRQFDIHGIQFHPESVLTPEGKNIVRNFIQKKYS